MNNGIILLTGLSGAGKTTLAKKLSYKLQYDYRYNVVHIDGDEFKKYVSPDLGFSLEDREENIRRLYDLCNLLLTNDILIIISFIVPTEELRQIIRGITDNYKEIYVRCPLEKCIERNPKGLYNKNIDNFTGVIQGYEEPVNPDLIIDTDLETIYKSLQKILYIL